MTDLDHAPVLTPVTSRRRSLWGAAGAAFVVCVLVGNGLTESVVGTDESPAGTAADLAAQASSTAVHVGLALEVVGLLLAAVFAGAVAVRGFRAVHARVPAVLAAVAGTTLLAVKLGSGAPYLAALSARDDLPDEVLHALVETNGAAFLLSWLPTALLVAATAVVLRRTGVGGKVLAGTGLALAALGGLAALVGLTDPGSAMPVPFLLGLVWIAVAGVRMALAR